jgi:hypothetical protein
LTSAGTRTTQEFCFLCVENTFRWEFQGSFSSWELWAYFWGFGHQGGCSEGATPEGARCCAREHRSVARVICGRGCGRGGCGGTSPTTPQRVGASTAKRCRPQVPSPRHAGGCCPQQIGGVAGERSQAHTQAPLARRGSGAVWPRGRPNCAFPSLNLVWCPPLGPAGGPGAARRGGRAAWPAARSRRQQLRAGKQS